LVYNKLVRLQVEIDFRGRGVMPRQQHGQIDVALYKILKLLIWLPKGRGLTQPEICRKTGLGKDHVESNMRRLFDLGWLAKSNTRPSIWCLSKKGLSEATRLLQTAKVKTTLEQDMISLLLSEPDRVWTVRQLGGGRQSTEAIYRLLNRLIESGWVSGNKQKVDGRNTKVYWLTEQGWQEAPQWLADQQP
jgi:DNA-binding IclR family transcriptional regulator